MSDRYLIGSLLEQEADREAKAQRSSSRAKPLDEVIEEATKEIAAVFARHREKVAATAR